MGERWLQRTASFTPSKYLSSLEGHEWWGMDPSRERMCVLLEYICQLYPVDHRSRVILPFFLKKVEIKIDNRE